MTNIICPIQKFQSAISGVGFHPPLTVITDGEYQTFDTKIQGKEIQTWYRFSPDLQTGCFGVVGLPVRWDYTNGNAQLATKPRVA
jgi:hypothetical protein